MSRQTDIQKLITIYGRRLQKLREQQAFQGMNAAPEIQLEIEVIEEKLEALDTALENIDSETTPAAPVEATPTVDIDEELARLDAQAQPQRQVQTGSLNVSDISGSSLDLGNIVTGNVAGDVVAGDKVGGDKIVGKGPAQDRARKQLKTALTSWQQDMEARIETLSDLDDEEIADLKKNLDRVATEAAKGAAAKPDKIVRWLNIIGVMAPEILAATIKMLQNPLAGVGWKLERIDGGVRLESQKVPAAKDFR